MLFLTDNIQGYTYALIENEKVLNFWITKIILSSFSSDFGFELDFYLIQVNRKVGHRQGLKPGMPYTSKNLHILSFNY